MATPPSGEYAPLGRDGTAWEAPAQTGPPLQQHTPLIPANMPPPTAAPPEIAPSAAQPPAAQPTYPPGSCPYIAPFVDANTPGTVFLEIPGAAAHV